jgi:ketosteroid isomerase-like protein
MKYLFFLLFLSAGITGLAQESQAARMAARKTIDSLNLEMEAAFNANDMLKVAAFYADDAEIAGKTYSVKGRADIDRYWLSLKDKGRGWKLEVIEIGGSGDFIYQLGKSDLKHITGNSPTPVSSITNFIVIWKQQPDGNYRIFKDYLTSTGFQKPGN